MVRIRARNAKQLIKKGRFLPMQDCNKCLPHSMILYDRFFYEKFIYALHELLMVEMRHRK